MASPRVPLQSCAFMVEEGMIKLKKNSPTIRFITSELNKLIDKAREFLYIRQVFDGRIDKSEQESSKNSANHQ
jgi:hypothetical protein